MDLLAEGLLTHAVMLVYELVHACTMSSILTCSWLATPLLRTSDHQTHEWTNCMCCCVHAGTLAGAPEDTGFGANAICGIHALGSRSST